METNEAHLILDIFTSDKELYKFCDPEFVFDNNKISVKILKRIQDALREYPKSYYMVDNHHKFFIVWIYAHSEWVLYSFGLHPDKRTKENLMRFWNSITQGKDGFTCYLYSNNTRAIDWLKRCGMREDGQIVESKNKVAIKLVVDLIDNGDMD